ncbi:hypothetical protein EX30DRAFT_174065 [Ascodesmis nigricans]|uniref:Zn(2)-C6 fungal-type domain-containing protein n=1 Tax=Ascodesmis nigricans TaxID=341454 RepID=A0A4S2MLR9_9PEZI|nr:hypothetical protein EX30DRAFT_174065 [Ascodesmis nigricans]
MASVMNDSTMASEPEMSQPPHHHQPPQDPHSTTPRSTPPTHKITRKRNRIPLSCGPCRNRKLKCNRASPCDNCLRRKDPSSCTYASTTSSSSTAAARAGRLRAANMGQGGEEMQRRIDRLEGLVLALMQSGSGAPGQKSGRAEEEREGEYAGAGEGADGGMEEVAEEVEKINTALGMLKFHGEKSYFRGETYWAALLGEIHGMRRAFTDNNLQYEVDMYNAATEINHCAEEQAPAQPAVPFSTCLGRQELIALIPVKGLVDLLVDAYFRNFDPLFHILHRPTFNRQLEMFYTNPSAMDTSWLALLFALLSVSLRMYHYSGEEPASLAGQTLSLSYHLRTACEASLSASKFVQKPFPHTIQAIFLFCIFPGENEKVDYLWPAMGMGIRIAMGMGLHREITNTPSCELTPREGEIRRRIWALFTAMDITISMRMGLPAMVREKEADTNPPRNIPDDAIPESGPLPEEGGREVMTEASYLIYYHAFVTLHAKTSATLQCLGRNYSYQDLQRLEASATTLRDSLPCFLRFQTLETCLANNDPVWLIIQRYTIDTLYQKTIILLYRPFSSRCTKDSTHIHTAREKCVDAAMRLLEYHKTLSSGHPALAHGRWILAVQRLNDYFLAVMILCLHLSVTAHESWLRQQHHHQHQHHHHPSSSSAASSSSCTASFTTPTSTNSPCPSASSCTSASSPSPPTEPPLYPREHIYRVLHGFKQVLARSTVFDYESAKAVKVLDMMFDKLRHDDPEFPQCPGAGGGGGGSENGDENTREQPCICDPDEAVKRAAEKVGWAAPGMRPNNNQTDPAQNQDPNMEMETRQPLPPAMDQTHAQGQMEGSGEVLSPNATLDLGLMMEDVNAWFPWGAPGWEEWDELMRQPPPMPGGPQGMTGGIQRPRSVGVGVQTPHAGQGPTDAGWRGGFNPRGGVAAGGGPVWMTGMGMGMGEDKGGR